MRLVAIIASLLLISAPFFPLMEGDGLHETMKWDAIIVLAAGVIALAVSIYEMIVRRANTGIALICCSFTGLALASYSLVEVNEGASNGTFNNAANTSIYLALLATVILLVIGIIIQKQFYSKGNNQGGVASFVANRIAFNQQKSFSRFIIRLSIVATVISVMVMIVTLAFANGFQETISQKVFSFWGHIRIQEKQPDKSVIAEEIPISKNDTLADLIKQDPRVQTIHPFATKYAILKTKDEIEGVMVKGLDSTYDFNHFKPFMVNGKPIQFNDSTYSREIMISAYTADQLKLKVNDRILIYFIRPGQEDQPGLNIRPDKLTIAGIFKTGIEEYDKTFAIGDIKLIQRLNDWAMDQIGGYEIFLHDYEQIDKAVEDFYAIDDFPQTWDTRSVRNISPNIFDWLNMQNVTRNVLIGFMIAVALINLITCLIILVLERIRMIGVLKALGANNWTVQKIFLRHSAIITITGIVIGTVMALALLYIQKETGFIKLKEEAYYLSEAAVKIVWWQVALISFGTLFICFLILMIPSILVRKIQPVKAIQFR